MDGDDEQGYGLWMVRGERGIRGGGPPCGKATLSGPMSQDYVEQIPDGMSWLMIHNSIAGTEL